MTLLALPKVEQLIVLKLPRCHSDNREAKFAHKLKSCRVTTGPHLICGFVVPYFHTEAVAFRDAEIKCALVHGKLQKLEAQGE